jgi:hypothetical protein
MVCPERIHSFRQFCANLARNFAPANQYDNYVTIFIAIYFFFSNTYWREVTRVVYRAYHISRIFSFHFLSKTDWREYKKVG